MNSHASTAPVEVAAARYARFAAAAEPATAPYAVALNRASEPANGADATQPPVDAQVAGQLADLARTFSELLLANVQNTASLNLSAARSLLAHARIPCNAAFAHRTETWNWSWRNFEICATSADQILNLARGHVERTTGALWAAAERICAQIDDEQSERARTLRRAFGELRDAQSAYWQSAQRAYGELLRFAQGEG